MNIKVPFFLILLLFSGFLCSIAIGGTANYDVQINGERMTLHCNKTPLHDILHEIRRQGVSVFIDPEINPKLTFSFQNKPVESVLKSVLRSFDYALIWEKDFETSAIRLDEIQIYQEGLRSRMTQLTGSGVLDIARDPKTGSLYVRNEILVKKPASMASGKFEEILSSVGGTIIEKDETIGIYRIRLPQGTDVSAIAEKLNQAGAGLSAEPNFAYPMQPSYRYLVDENALDGYEKTVSGDPAKGLPVAILDSGMMAGVGLEENAVAAFDAVSPGDPVVDRLGHGTQMAMVAAGLVDPMGAEAEEDDTLPVIPIRAFDDNGVTSNFIMMRSIQFALENGAKVLSLSWGSETSSPFMEEALGYAQDNGMIVVASAGNEPTGQSVYPAAYSSVIGVAALSPDGTAWKQSNYGDSVSVSAPGFANFPVGYKGEAGLYAGTSIAAAYVSRQISEYVSAHPGATMKEIQNYLSKPVSN